MISIEEAVVLSISCGGKATFWFESREDEGEFGAASICFLAVDLVVRVPSLAMVRIGQKQVLQGCILPAVYYGALRSMQGKATR